MALRVWLPLNGTLENKGISNGNASIDGSISVDNSGKIGKCYKFGTANGRMTIPVDIMKSFTRDASIAFWIKINTWNKDYATIFQHGLGTTPWTAYRFGVLRNNNNRLHLAISDGSNSYHSLSTDDLTLGQWYHIAFTYKSGECSCYVNGLFLRGGTTTVIPGYSGATVTTIGAINSSGGYQTDMYLNDLRIYDHCLSPKEVKEISQGLVLHYKLDGWSGGSGENLVEDGDLINKSTLKNSTRTNCNSVTSVTSTSEGLHLITPSSGNQNNGILFTYSQANTQLGITYGDTITYSVDLKGTSDSNNPKIQIISNYTTNSAWWYSTGNSTTSYFIQDLSSEWKRYSVTKTLPADSGGSYFIVGFSINGNQESDLYIRNVKVEFGSTATSWSLAPQDLDIDTTKITDSSGYGYDGTVTGTLTAESNSDRYNVSSYFNGSSYITVSNPWKSGSIVTEFTHTAWIKWNSNCSTSAGIHSIAGANSFFRFSLGKSNKLWAYGLRSSLDGGTTSAAGLGQYGSATSLVNGQWYFIAVTFKNGVCKCYCDGELVGTADNSATYPALKSTIDNLYIGSYSGGGELAIGNVADSRMYCTALSAEDILDLYHTSANIDNEKRLHSFEFVEDDGNRVDEQGLVHSGLLSSDSDLIKLLYDKKLHIEPDGSVWAHIYHHNRPDLGSFASTNDFANSVKIDDNRWFNATEIVNSFSSEWEFLIIYNFTQGGTVYKERWIQTKNPETAIFGDVDAADITRVTGDEYKTGTWGGLYKKNGSAYWVLNNGTNGNWWGATGSFSIYQGGIPGYGGTITTTGCNDLYIRIDRFSSTPTHASIGRGSIYIFNDFIEK